VVYPYSSDMDTLRYFSSTQKTELLIFNEQRTILNLVIPSWALVDSYVIGCTVMLSMQHLKCRIRFLVRKV